MAADVRAYVKQCQTYYTYEIATRNSQGYVRPLHVPEYCWQHITMDLLTCLPKREQGVDAIAIFVDWLSKYTYFVPVNTTISADELAQVFFATVVAHHGVPERLILERDPRFVSAFWKGLMSALGAQVALSTAYHPQTDGKSERQRRSLEQILRCYVSPRQHDWDLLLPCTEFALNTIQSSAIGYTPAYTLYGRDPNLPLEAAVGKVTDFCVASVSERVARMSAMVQQVCTVLVVTTQSMERQVNRHHRDSEIHIRANARLSMEHLCLPPGLTHKFSPRFVGPFEILAAVNPVFFYLRLPAAWRIHPVFHILQLKAAFGNAITDFPSNTVYSPPPDKSGEYKVEDILDMRMSRSGVREFRIFQKGYSLFEST